METHWHIAIIPAFLVTSSCWAPKPTLAHNKGLNPAVDLRVFVSLTSLNHETFRDSLDILKYCICVWLMVLCWSRTCSSICGMSWIDCSWVSAKIDFSQGKKSSLLESLSSFSTAWILSRITSSCADCRELAARRKDPLSLFNPSDCGGKTWEAWRREQWHGAQSWEHAQLITTLDCTHTHTHVLYAEMCQEHTHLLWWESDCSFREESCDASVLIWSWPH